MQPPESGAPDSKYSDEKNFIPTSSRTQYNKQHHMGIYNALQKFRKGIKSAMRKEVKSRQTCQRHPEYKLDEGGETVISKRGNSDVQ